MRFAPSAPFSSLWLSPALALVLVTPLGGCKQPPPGPADGKADAEVDPDPDPDAGQPDASTDAADAAGATAGPAADPGASGADHVDRLLTWLAPEPTAVSFDRVQERLDAAVLSVVFGVPPKSADLLDERETLDEALDIVFDGDAEPHNWLDDRSLAFTVALSKTPYFIRLLTKPKAEVAALLDAHGFTKNEVEGFDIYFPSGSLPWRVALLDGDVAAFIPVDVPGAGLEPLASAKAEPASEVETELRRALGDEVALEFVLLSLGPLMHYDVKQTLTQVNFSLRRAELGSQHGYEGMVRLVPSADADSCAEDLRKRAHPEENQQVQALLGQVAFVVDQGTVVGNLGIQPDQLKHFLAR